MDENTVKMQGNLIVITKAEVIYNVLLPIISFIFLTNLGSVTLMFSKSYKSRSKAK